MTISRRVSHLATYLSWLKRRNLIDADPRILVSPFDQPKRAHYLPRPLSPEIDRLFQEKLEQSDHIYSKAFLLMRLTGLRLGELRRLEFQCLRQDTADNYSLKVPLGKLKNERLVPVDGTVMDIIIAIQNMTLKRVSILQEPTYLFSGANNHYPSQKVFYEHFKQISVGLPEHITTHQLRHSYASTMLAAGMNLISVMKLLGHTSPKMTLRYTEITQPKIREEYFRALEQISRTRYNSLNQLASSAASYKDNFNQAALDFVLALKQAAQKSEGAPKRRLTFLINRLQRLRSELETLTI